MDRSGQTRSFLSIEVKNKITLNKENEAGNKLNLLTTLQIIILQRSSWLAIQTLINQRLTNLAILAEVRKKRRNRLVPISAFFLTLIFRF